MSKGNNSFTATMWLLGFVVGINTGNVIRAFTDDTKDKVDEAQVQNELVEYQLERDYGQIGDIGHLVLDTESDTFKFILDGEQTCEGDYEVRNDRAKIVGEVECTYKVEQ